MRESMMSLSITCRMYGWSKWGGAREGLVKEDLDEWYCQTCGQRQIKILPSYMFPTDDTQRDFVRVCTMCKAKSLLFHLDELSELLDLLK